MKRSIRNLYIAAGAVSVFLYVLGIATGIYVQKSLLPSVESDINSIRKDVENAQQEYLLFSFRGKESCPVLSSLSADISSKLRSLADELIRLENSGEKGLRFLELKKEYGALSIRAWILRSSTNENCEENILPVLYYYSVPCAECLEQGQILDSLREKGILDKASVYVLDKDIDHPLVSTLVKSHGIGAAPAMVIGDTVYSDFISAETLKEIICQRTNATACKKQPSS